MLVFFIHGVNTQNTNYADNLIRKIKKSFTYRSQAPDSYFYSSFWGNLYNNKKHQIISCIEKDYSRACDAHPEYHRRHSGIYRYIKHRNQFINGFLGDFLIYQNPIRGLEIRRNLYKQLNQFLLDHPHQKEIHFIAHSLGSIILWDLLFSENITEDDPAYILRKSLEEYKLLSITTMGSPLLFLKQMMDLDFSNVNSSEINRNKDESNFAQKIRWVNIIHSSDIIAYPLKAAIEKEISSNILFFDQFVWQYGNAQELGLFTVGSEDLAMISGASDAHSSYFANNTDGSITARIISYNLLGEINKLYDRCVTPR